MINMDNHEKYRWLIMYTRLYPMYTETCVRSRKNTDYWQWMYPS